MIVACFILVAIAGVAKAVMDTLQFHFLKSVFSRLGTSWDPQFSWKCKYKSDLKTPAFFGSTTFFVWMTDAWHLFQLIFLTSIFAAMVNYSGVSSSWFELTGFTGMFVDFVILRSVFGVTFVLFYNYILVKK